MKTFRLFFFLCLLGIFKAYAQAPSAAFTYPRTGLTANFNLTYPDGTATYTWDFGDGNTGVGLNPTHIYATEGVYEASLIAMNGFGSDTTARWLSVTDNTSCLYSDSLELVAFYNATGGPNWTNTWDLSTPVSTWYGVTVIGCGVTCLDLDGEHNCLITSSSYGGNKLIGNIPDLNLTNLSNLYLSYNQLSGNIPDFSSLNNLSILYLRNNRLSGNIPDFSSLTNLEYLSLYSNRLSGNVPDFSSLTNLESLSLAGNQLSGNIPEFSSLTNLESLYLAGNQLSGNIPEFSSLTNLESLSLHINQLSGNIPEFSSLTNLKYLSLGNNQLSGNIPEFSSLTNLESLYLGNNQLSGNIPEFSSLNNLSILSLTNNQLSGNIPEFSSLTNLSDLYLFNNQLSGNIPEFSSLTNLSWLILDNNQLSGIIPEFSSLTNLSLIILHSNQLSGNIPEFSSLTNLFRLYLGNNQLSGNIPEFSSLTNLLGLYLNNNQLSGNIPDFSSFTNLSELYLNNNQFNFNDLSLNLSNNLTIQDYLYAPQDSINTIINANSLSVDAGGNIADNSYLWYKDGIEVNTIVGDSSYVPPSPGYYQCRVENAIVTRPQVNQELHLWSRVVYYAQTCPAPSLFLIASPDNTTTTCPEDGFTFNLFDPFNGLGNYERTVFLVNGIIVQDSSSTTFFSNTLQNGDIVTANAYDASNCRYDIANPMPITINAYPSPQISTCTPTANSLEISLDQGGNWSFDLLSYEGDNLLSSENHQVSGNTITLPISPNLRYEIQNIDLANDPCTYTETIPVSQITGCEAICVGYSDTYSESYTANFVNTAASIQWEISPPSALTNGDITLLSGQNSNVLEVDFSNANPLDKQITLQATAITYCGTEVLEFLVKLDTDCVFPGDVNHDGQADIYTNINYIDDAIALEFAKEQYDAYQNNQNGDILHSPSRDAGCLASDTRDWLPQAATDWQMETPNSVFYPAPFNILDGNGNPTAAFNLKHADCNGNGTIETNQLWNPFQTPFSTITNPTDHDLVVFHAINERKHTGNTPTAKGQNNTTESLRIVASSDTLTNGDEVVFTVYMGSTMAPVIGLHHISFVGEGAFGTYKQPSISMMNSHLSPQNSSRLVDYPVLHPNYNGVENDSLRWYTSISRPDNLSYGIDFTGEEVCQLICHVTVDGLLDDEPSSTTKTSNGPVPVTFKIPAAGIILENGSVIYIQSQTDTIWVRPNPTLNAHLFLEGPFDPTTNLMRDELRLSGLIPATEPFTALGYDFPYADMRGLRMTDSMAVLSVSGQDAIVDWVFIEVRDKLDPSIVISARPALLTRHGDVVDMDGKSAPRLWHTPQGEHYVVIKTRNHLAVMTAQPVLLNDDFLLVDFVQTVAYGNGTKLLPSGIHTLYAGDANGDGTVDAGDRSETWNNRNTSGYLLVDCNMDGVVDAADRSIPWNNRNIGTAVP